MQLVVELEQKLNLGCQIPKLPAQATALYGQNAEIEG